MLTRKSVIRKLTVPLNSFILAHMTKIACAHSIRAAIKGDSNLIGAVLQHSLLRAPRNLVTRFIEKSITDGSCLVACHNEEPDVLFGFAICSPHSRAIHYVYTKPAFRKFGIARALVTHAFGDVMPKYYTFRSQEFPNELVKKYNLKLAPIAGML